MHLIFNLRCLAAAFIFGLGFPLLSQAGNSPTLPIVDDPIPAQGEPFRVEPKIPVGKTLLFPITASHPQGAPLSISAVSADPRIMVRVRNGCPHLRFTISHAGNPAITDPADPNFDPAFTGVMEFQLFRDWSPETVAFIAGFAQARFYNNLIFHRNADLSGGQEGVPPSFIFQGGDPLGDSANANLRGTGGPGMIGTQGSTAFKFDNEFHPATIFSGRGQLAMANSGTSQFGSSAYKGSNGSQFFITDGQPRHLDFNHTIMGQLVRGWDVLAKLKTAPREPSTSDFEDKPKVDIVIDSAEIVWNDHDAVLIFSATAPGTSIITITATAPDGAISSKTFTATSVPDTVNSPPFLLNPPNGVAKVNQVVGIPAIALDLEQDYLFLGNTLFDPSFGTPPGRSSGSGNPALLVGNAGYSGILNLGLTVTQYDMSYRGTVDGSTRATDDFTSAHVGVGDLDVRSEATTIYASPGNGLINEVVAQFTDRDARGKPTDWTAIVNWGDGTPVQGSSTAGSGVTVSRSMGKPGMTAFQVAGAHTYAQPGIYMVRTQITGSKGYREIFRNRVIVSADPIKALGENLSVRGPLASGMILATFSDTQPMPPSAYSVTAQWGDGSVGVGRLGGLVVRPTSGGKYQVVGTHRWPDPQGYPVAIQISRAGAVPATALATVRVTGFKAPQYLPPFSMAHLVADWSGGPIKETDSNNVTTWRGDIVVLNAGSKTSPKSKLRFYLSLDTELQTSGPNADIPLTIGPTLKEVSMPALPSGAGIRYSFVKTSMDFRIRAPVGQRGSGLTLMAALDYDDPILDHMVVDRELLAGPFNPFIVAPTSLTVEESGANQIKEFRVRLESVPTADVTMTLSVVNSSNQASTQADVNPKTLIFTPQTWLTDQVVQVMGTNDPDVDNDQNVTVRIVAESDDARYETIAPPSVAVAVRDDEAKLSATPTSITTTEAEGSTRTATFSVRFNKAPAGDVTVAVTSLDLSEATVSPAILNFTAANGIDPQVVTVTGVDDASDDGDVSYTIRMTYTPSGSSIPVTVNVSGRNTDND